MRDMFETPDYVDNAGIKIAVYRSGPETQQTTLPPIIFMHGFPELARSWRAQMEALGKAGYPCFAPDMRGYGKSDKPEGKAQYAITELVTDLKAILRRYEIEKAIFVGHDWGAILLWTLPFYMPEHLIACAGLNYPLMPRLPINPIWALRLNFHRKMYMLQFQKEGRGEAVLEKDVERTMRFFMRRVDPARNDNIDMSFKGKSLNILEQLQGPESEWIGAPLLTDEELQIYIDTFRENGFTAPLQWYRNLSRNWKDMKQFLVKKKLPFVDLPCLIITSDKDFATPPRFSNGMHKLCGPVTRVDLKDCSHWVQMEKPHEVNEALLDWLPTVQG